MVIDGNDHRGIDVGILTKADHAITRPLLETNLKDMTAHSALTADPKRPGTYGNGTASGKIDYVLLSRAPFELVEGGAIFRRGMGRQERNALGPLSDHDGC